MYFMGLSLCLFWIVVLLEGGIYWVSFIYVSINKLIGLICRICIIRVNINFLRKKERK